MATQKPISTISYNTEPFLKEKLDNLVKQHIIQAYQYIGHKGEDGDKDHFHIRVEPNKAVDIMNLTEVLTEYIAGEQKPRIVRPWRPSKEEDWFLYVVHDADYLRIKQEEVSDKEKLPYDYTDIVVSEGYDLEVAFMRAKATLKHLPANVMRRLKSGEAPDKLVETGENPMMVSTVQRLLTDTNKSVIGKYNDAMALLKGIAYAMIECNLYLYCKDGKYSLSFDGADENLGEPVKWPFEVNYREYSRKYLTPAEKENYYKRLKAKTPVYLTTDEEEWIANYETELKRRQEEQKEKMKGRTNFHLSDIDYPIEEEEV